MKKIRIALIALPLLLALLSCQKEMQVIYTGNPPPDTLAFTPDEEALIMAGSDTNMMHLLTIDHYEDSLILRKISTDVRPDSNDAVLMRLVNRMLATMLDPTNTGVGIAAPQVGINRNIIWVQRMDKPGDPNEVYLNAKITLYSNKEVLFAGDGCLSIPGVTGTSHRKSSVVVEYDLLDGTHHEELVEGYSYTQFTAIIFQHEIDHLNGILFIDRL